MYIECTLLCKIQYHQQVYSSNNPSTFAISKDKNFDILMVPYVWVYRDWYLLDMMLKVGYDVFA